MNRDELLEKVAKGLVSVQEAIKIMGDSDSGLRCKVSEKGALSVYGLQRMPVTLYVEQWDRLLNFGETIRLFMENHAEEFTRKGDPKKPAEPAAE